MTAPRPTAATTQRKKRHIHQRPHGQHAGPQLSSSRDASEEDNDDASTYSDSASSLRALDPPDPSSLPTSARDRALVNSNPANANSVAAGAINVPQQSSASLRRPSGGADKTPAAYSPPTDLSALPPAQRGLASQTAYSRDSNVAATLASASAALSSAEVLPSGALTGPPLTAASPSPRAPARRRESTSSASSANAAYPAAAPSESPETSSGLTQSATAAGGALHLGNLAAAVPNALATPMTSTPRADIGSKGASESLKALQSRGGEGYAEEDAEADNDADREGDETDNGTNTDGLTASPYDGDVEGPAGQPTSAPGGPGSSLAPAVTPSTSAPIDTPSKSWIEGERPAGELEEEEVSLPSPASIRAWFQSCITNTSERAYKINPPPDGGRNLARPVRIYADGVYDLFHYAHSLQLRQAKLAFPSVHLIVGVCSSTACAQNKNRPVLSSSERYTSVRNCRWVDEVVEDAPWVIDQSLLDRLRIDYVAHDDAPYGGAGSEDIYDFVKRQGKFLPTKRTPGVSTSELLVRIVEQYRKHSFDSKFAGAGFKDLAYHSQENLLKK